MNTEDPKAKLDNLEFKVYFELDRKLLPLSVLNQLKPGQVINLNCDLNAPVKLRVNDQVIARGRMVDVGGSLGIQIIENV